jgi:uncharacterized membrane protein
MIASMVNVLSMQFVTNEITLTLHLIHVNVSVWSYLRIKVIGRNIIKSTVLNTYFEWA